VGEAADFLTAKRVKCNLVDSTASGIVSAVKEENRVTSSAAEAGEVGVSSQLGSSKLEEHFHAGRLADC
ncbi:hypothetical protein AKJ16_DCAP23153, partial [Drosera capensis]